MLSNINIKRIDLFEYQNETNHTSPFDVTDARLADSNRNRVILSRPPVPGLALAFATYMNAELVTP